MKNYITPSINEWSEKNSEFTITIMATDDVGNRICNKQLYAVYDLRENISETPDLNSSNAKTIYSATNGVIQIDIKKKCRLAIKLYKVQIFDEYLDIGQLADNYIEEILCNDIFIPFEPYVIDFRATYDSSKIIPVGSKIPLKNIKLYMTFNNGSTKTVKASKEKENCYLSRDIIYRKDENKITVYYKDLVLEKIWEYDIIVIGKSKELRIEAVYTGDEKKIGDVVKQSEVFVSVLLDDGEDLAGNPTEPYMEGLDTDKWYFGTFPKVNNKNLGRFEIILNDQDNDLRTFVKVKFKEEPIRYRLDAWYEGYQVKKGKSYIPDNFRIYLYDQTGRTRMLEYNECYVSPENKTLNEVGWHWFEVTYTIENYVLKDKVAIYCYEPPELEECDLIIERINYNTQSYEDVTNYFKEILKIGDLTYVNWAKILTKVSKLEWWGDYRLTAPPLTGLDTRFKTEWVFTCDDKKGIRSMLNKVFREIEDKKAEENPKEENEDGS